VIVWLEIVGLLVVGAIALAVIWYLLGELCEGRTYQTEGGWRRRP
jgi:hypothetical protein